MPRSETPKPDVPRGTSGEPEPTQRVIRVDQAERCCRLAAEDLLASLSDFANQIATIHGTSDGLALTGGEALGRGFGAAQGRAPEGRPRITRFAGDVPAGSVQIVPAGWLLDPANLFTGVVLKLVEGTQAIADALRDFNRTKDGPCTQCLMRLALPQYPQRRSQFTLTLRGQPAGTVSKRV